jgi:predicted membrane GTPase involved in stress response
VLIQHDESGNKLEPVEEVTMEVDEEQCGSMIAHVTARKGNLLDMKVQPSRVAGQPARARIQCRMLSRGMIGFATVFQSETRGTGVINRRVLGYEPFEKGLNQSANRNGAIISTEAGMTTLHALHNIQARGQLFVGAREPVYAGQIIGDPHFASANDRVVRSADTLRAIVPGESSRQEMMNVNPVKVRTILSSPTFTCELSYQTRPSFRWQAKALTNFRAAGKEENLILDVSRHMTLEEAMGWMVPVRTLVDCKRMDTLTSARCVSGGAS